MKNNLMFTTVSRSKAALLMFILALIALGCSSNDKLSALPSQAQFLVRTLADSTGSCADTAAPCARIEVTYPEITTTGFPEATDAVNAEVEMLLLNEYADTPDEFFPEDLVSDFLTDYEQMIWDSPDYTIPWMKTIEISVIANGGDVLSLEYLLFTYTGGAHPNAQIAFRNFDLKTGSQPPLYTMLRQGADTTLNRLGERAFRETRGLGPNESLAEAGFWFNEDRFVLPTEYLIDVTGLTFVFNAYEIAPYSMGPTEFTIPYAILDELLLPQSPVVRWLEFLDAISSTGS